MASLNKASLIGNVGNAPDIRTMQSGGRVCNLSLATSDQWKDKTTGERREDTEWHNIVIFNEGLISVCEQYVQKGARLYIEGAIKKRKWQDQSGQDKYTTEIVLKPYNGTLKILSSAPNGNTNNTSQGQSAQMPDDFEDDIPF